MKTTMKPDSKLFSFFKYVALVGILLFLLFPL